MSPAPSPADTDPNAGPDRLGEAEIRLSLLDDQLDALNRTVFRQQQQIDLLTKALVYLQRQMRSGGSVASTDPRDDIPPHY